MNFEIEQRTPFQSNQFNAGPPEMACDFCPNVLESISEKTAHLLEHFVQEMCSDCNESLIRIGDSFYVLHTRITCIKSDDTERQNQQTPSPPLPIQVNLKNEIFLDESSPEDQTTEEITIDPSIKIEPMFFDSIDVKNSMNVSQQNDDKKLSTAEPTKLTRVRESRLAERVRRDKELIECPIAGCGQMIKRAYKPKHIKEKHDAGFKCDRGCDARFMTKGTLEKHAKHCVSSEKFTCAFCFASYPSQKSLTIHKYENHKSEKEKRTQTNTAKPIASDSIDADETSTIAVQQNDNGKTSTTAVVGRRKAERLQYEKEMIECPIDGCGQIIRRSYKSSHIKERHGAGFKCDRGCDARFMSKGTFEQHIKQCVASEKFMCEFCFASYTSKRALVRHKYENHKSEREKRAQTNKIREKTNRSIYLNAMIKCNVNGCDFVTSKKRMPEHMKDVHGTGYTCPMANCGKIFLSNDGFDNHQLLHAAGIIHDENHIFTCDHCNSSISTKKSLIVHMRHHVPKDDRVECDICNKKFIDKCGLHNHMRIHAESQFICSYCSREFKIKTHLTTHERIHTGERPVRCRFDCGKTFRTSALRCQHERIHTGERRYRCSQVDCSKAYAYDVDLKRHLFSVHKIWTKKHPCPQATCENVIFPERKLLRKHLKSVHGIGD